MLPSSPTDQQVLALARQYQLGGNMVEILTNDYGIINAASAMGIRATPLGQRRRLGSIREAYKGWRELSNDEFFKIRSNEIIRAAREGRSVSRETMEDILERKLEFSPNEFLILPKNTRLPPSQRALRYDNQKDEFTTLTHYLRRASLGKKGMARNTYQACFYDLLYDPSITLAMGIGPAGTGKTFSTMRAAIDLTTLVETTMTQKLIGAGFKGLYQRVIVSRSVAGPKGEEIGYLPGDIKEKFSPIIKPVFEAYRKILHDAYKIDEEAAMAAWEYALQHETLELLPLQYMRGRSPEKAIMICEEAQNLSIHTLSLFVTRAGEGTKVVLIGDAEQIDTPGLTPEGNGVVIASEAHKGDSTAGTIFFPPESVERSDRAAKTVRLLQEYLQ